VHDFADGPGRDEPGLTVVELADRAGVGEPFVAQLVETGILAARPGDRYTEGDVRRVRIVHALDEARFPLDTLAEAIQRGDLELGFADDPSYALFSGLSDRTFRDVNAATGIPLELLFTIRESMGSAPPEPDDRLRQMEIDVVPAIEMMLAQGVRQHVIDRSLRAYGDSLRRVAEVESDWWRSDVIEPIMARGGGIADVGPQTTAFANAFEKVSTQMLLAIYRGHQTNSWMKNIFEGFEAALARAGLLARIDRPPAICFLDLSGYTRLTDERGDEHAADLAGRLSRLVQRTSSQHGGKAIKWLGDGVMFHFRDPGPGVLAALEMVEGADQADLPPAHVGLHAGPVLFQEGDYFGRTVNVAARIADYARRGEVLVSDEVVAASDVPGIRFDPIGPVELKGLSEAVSLHVARRST
jgi:adenylate cyclase